MTTWARRVATIQVLATSLTGAAAPAGAQYFGRNKVQYESFAFEVLKTPHFDVYYYPGEATGAAQAGRLAERWYARLSKVLRHELRGRQPLILYGSHPDFEQTNAIPGALGEGTGGVTETLKRRIVLPLAGPLAETNHVIGHELVHAFQFDITGQGQGRFRRARGRSPAALVRRGDGGVPLPRARRRAHGDVAAGRRATPPAAHAAPAVRPGILPLPLRPRVLGLCRRPLRWRWNWGVVAQQIPFYAGAYGAAIDTVAGDVAYLEQVVLERQTNRELALLSAYPFNTVQRVEFAAGVQSITFDIEVETRATSLTTGRVLFDTTASLPTPGAITLWMGSAALVHDNSFFGATSPILGRRYRLEVAPAIGTIDLVSVLADYRRYVLPVRPFTLAARILHYGRYGSGAEDPRLSPLFLGYPSLVRGYDIGSFSADECPIGSASCPAFDQLLGSRLLVANLEVRFPLLGLLGAGGGYYGGFPLEMALFGDGGVAWTDASKASFLGGPRQPVTSAGVALRANLLGFAIAELDWVRPFDRPGKGWYLHLSLTPGF